MTKSTKAILLSTLVFPGIGHFYLKKHIPGMVLALAGFASLYYIISRMVRQAMLLADQFLRSGAPLDVATITEWVSKQPMGTEAGRLDIAWAVLLITWLIGIVDTYRAGRLQSKVDMDSSQ